MYRILWADDEIELLKAHIIFLKSKGYEVIAVTNGDDAISTVKNQTVDIVLLDEMMPGKDGLTTLNTIKDLKPQVPVIMITKNEEESLMEEAIGKRIDDYLTKPVNPSQILMACKKLLERRDIVNEQRSQQYAREMSNISMSLMNVSGADDWIEMATKLFRMDMELDSSSDNDFRNILYDQRKECNKEFCKFVEKDYPRWVNNPQNRPTLSTDLVQKYLVPGIKRGRKSILIVIDCMRLDQWYMLEPFFYDWFQVETKFYYSVLPTSTPFSRNAIFSGLFPREIEKTYPQFWSLDEDDESLNKYEKELLELQLKRNHVDQNLTVSYVKIMNNNDANNFDKNLNNFVQADVMGIVINFVDILAHSRSDLPILREIAPNEPAYRSLTKSWFQHSPFMSVFSRLAEMDVDIYLTSDHGSVRGLTGAKVIGDRETSTSLRYKFGRSLKVDKKQAVLIKNPHEWQLPMHGINTTYIIAKENNYFVYPNNYNKFIRHYKDSFQHGGISMEEVILPIIKLTSKK